MGRRLLRCRNPACPVQHGTVLGRLTSDGGVVLDPAVHRFRAYLDTRKAVLVCPACGTERDFRGTVVASAH